MGKYVTAITYEFDITDELKSDISDKELYYIIKQKVARAITEYIINNFDTLPMLYSKRWVEESGYTKYKIKLNLISDDKLNKLLKNIK